MTSPRIISIVNQKGGVGKTTTAINLASSLAESGARVLLVDMDPQGNASTGLGVATNERDLTSYDLILGDVNLTEVAKETSVSGLLICPANVDLASADMDLSARDRRSFLLRDALSAPLSASLNLDFILVDCPPSLSVLTVNALVASDSVLIPLQAEFYALEGLSQLLVTIREVRQSANPALRIEGVLLTMTDGRNRLSQQVEADARATLGDVVFATTVPRNVKLSEAPSFGKSIGEYDRNSRGAEAYRALAQELLARFPLTNKGDE